MCTVYTHELRDDMTLTVKLLSFSNYTSLRVVWFKSRRFKSWFKSRFKSLDFFFKNHWFKSTFIKKKIIFSIFSSCLHIFFIYSFSFISICFIDTIKEWYTLMKSYLTPLFLFSTVKKNWWKKPSFGIVINNSLYVHLILFNTKEDIKSTKVLKLHNLIT